MLCCPLPKACVQSLCPPLGNHPPPFCRSQQPGTPSFSYIANCRYLSLLETAQLGAATAPSMLAANLRPEWKVAGAGLLLRELSRQVQFAFDFALLPTAAVGIPRHSSMHQRTQELWNLSGTSPFLP
ncbi:hypothetical protein QCA50_013843 [Cerrena zonata]|uniref:Uncharacterized protein n=1 Tax=Cerrena zonata TaxID=2478898 RepID=A0AAW0G290_9APHY